MSLQGDVRRLLAEFGEHKAGRDLTDVMVAVADAWDVRVGFTASDRVRFGMRNVAVTDVDWLRGLGQVLSARAKEMFCCYPWYDNDGLGSALQEAVDNAVGRVDASYVLEAAGEPAGHFFLWKGGHNEHSAEHGLEVPELGIVIADAYQGRGLGGLAVRFLVAVARALGADAVELTTDLSNEAGARTYLSVGFEEVGEIWNPQDVDVTAALAGEVKAPRWNVERQMVYLLNGGKRQAVCDYLGVKRGQFVELHRDFEEAQQ